MATEASLETGGTYFVVAFEDSSFTRPVIETYEFLGKNIDGVPSEPSESEYFFRIVNSDGDQLMLTEKQIWQALDIHELIQKLIDFRDGKIK